MLLDTYQIWNAVELCPADGGGHIPMRVPSGVRQSLSENGQVKALQPGTTEIRFHLPINETATVRLRSLGTSTAIPFYGDQQGLEVVRLGKETTVLQLARMEQRSEIARHSPPLPPATFDSSLVRVLLDGDPVVIESVEGSGLRPPTAGEVPRETILCYGTSITHGVSSTGPHLSYPAWLGRLLGSNVLNMGMRGSAYCEKELADDLAERNDWQMAVLELSVNMVTRFDDDEFARRVGYLIRTMAESDSNRPIFVFSHLPCFRDFAGADSELRMVSESKRLRLAEEVARIDAPNLFYREGPELLPETGFLAMDMIHWSDHGFAVLAQRVADWIRSTRPS